MGLYIYFGVISRLFSRNINFRIFFIGAKEKQIPSLIAMIHHESLTPIPALLATVSITVRP